MDRIDQEIFYQTIKKWIIFDQNNRPKKKGANNREKRKLSILLKFCFRHLLPKSVFLAVILIGHTAYKKWIYKKITQISMDFFSTTTTLFRCSYWLILAHMTTNGVQKIKIKIFKSKRPRDIPSSSNISKYQRQGAPTTLKRIKHRMSGRVGSGVG